MYKLLLGLSEAMDGSMREVVLQALKPAAGSTMPFADRVVVMVSEDGLCASAGPLFRWS